MPAISAQYSYFDLKTGETNSVEIKKFNESPILRSKVAAGELLPVEERISEEPLVVKPVEEIGQYGGVWRRVYLGSSDIYGSYYLFPEHLIRHFYSPDRTRVFIVTNLAKDWEMSENGKTFTFYLREGMKWSDGAPFTADDFVFWYEDIVLNDELTTVRPGWLKAGGELGKLEKIDDYTVRFSFSTCYNVFVERLAGWGAPLVYAPKHCLKQFHPKYTSMNEINKMMKKESFTIWVDLFRNKATRL